MVRRECYEHTDWLLVQVPREGLHAKWLKDGEALPDKPKKYKPYCKHHSYALEIKDADENDEGDYSVIIKGKKSSATLSVEVWKQLF